MRHPDWLRTHASATGTASCVTSTLAAGARLVGKTQCDELFFSLEGENAHYGTPINPAAPERIPGGSSSGAAVAVAGGLAEFAKARDALMRVSALLQGWTLRAAEQFNPSTVWSLVCDHLKRILAAIAPNQAHRALENHALGAG